MYKISKILFFIIILIIYNNKLVSQYSVTSYDCIPSKKKHFLLSLYSNDMYILSFSFNQLPDVVHTSVLSFGKYVDDPKEIILYDSVFDDKIVFKKKGKKLTPKRFYDIKNKITFGNERQERITERMINLDFKDIKRDRIVIDSMNITRKTITCKEYRKGRVALSINNEFMRVRYCDYSFFSGKIKNENGYYSFYDKNWDKEYKFYVDEEGNIVMNFSKLVNGVFIKTCHD